MSATPHGLAPFDEPVYLENRATEPLAPVPPSDAVSRPVIAFLCRAGLVVALSATTPYLDDQAIAPGVIALIIFHLPIATAFDLHRARTPSRPPWVNLVPALLDLAVVSALAAAVDRGVVLGTVGILLVAIHRWLYGRIVGAVSIVLVSMILIALTVWHHVDTDWFDVVSRVSMGILLVWLVDDQATRHQLTSRGLHLVASKAEAVLAGIGDAIVSTDARGRLQGVNPAAATLLGIDEDGARSEACASVLGMRSADGQPLRCDSGCAILREGGVAVEVQRTGPRGNRQPLLASAVALRDDDGDPIEIVHLLRDITSLKQAEEAKTLFLATTSHELKTPLAVIRGYAQLLRKMDLDEAATLDALQTIETRAGQLVGIVDRLLMSSRIDAGRIELRPELGPIAGLIQSRVLEFAETCRPVELELDDELPNALAEPAALSTVIDHLLENADKYSPEDASIALHVHADAEWVHLAVRDHGIGMDAEQMERCFDRFWQAEGTDVRRFGGTGIGLYIVRSLVEAMHGHVDVRPNDGRGVTFTVHLRRHPAAPTEEIDDDRSNGNAIRTDGEQSMIREFMRQVGVLTDTGASP